MQTSGVHRLSVCQHFQTTSPLKPEADSFHIAFTNGIKLGNTNFFFISFTWLQIDAKPSTKPENLFHLVYEIWKNMK